MLLWLKAMPHTNQKVSPSLSWAWARHAHGSTMVGKSHPSTPWQLPRPSALHPSPSPPSSCPTHTAAACVHPVPIRELPSVRPKLRALIGEPSGLGVGRPEMGREDKLHRRLPWAPTGIMPAGVPWVVAQPSTATHPGASRQQAQPSQEPQYGQQNCSHQQFQVSPSIYGILLHSTKVLFAGVGTVFLPRVI